MLKFSPGCCCGGGTDCYTPDVPCCNNSITCGDSLFRGYSDIFIETVNEDYGKFGNGYFKYFYLEKINGRYYAKPKSTFNNDIHGYANNFIMATVSFEFRRGADGKSIRELSIGVSYSPKTFPFSEYTDSHIKKRSYDDKYHYTYLGFPKYIMVFGLPFKISQEHIEFCPEENTPESWALADPVELSELQSEETYRVYYNTLADCGISYDTTCTVTVQENLIFANEVESVIAGLEDRDVPPGISVVTFILYGFNHRKFRSLAEGCSFLATTFYSVCFGKQSENNTVRIIVGDHSNADYKMNSYSDRNNYPEELLEYALDGNVFSPSQIKYGDSDNLPETWFNDNYERGEGKNIDDSLLNPRGNDDRFRGICWVYAYCKPCLENFDNSYVTYGTVRLPAYKAVMDTSEFSVYKYNLANDKYVVMPIKDVYELPLDDFEKEFYYYSDSSIGYLCKTSQYGRINKIPVPPGKKLKSIVWRIFLGDTMFLYNNTVKPVSDTNVLTPSMRIDEAQIVHYRKKSGNVNLYSSISSVYYQLPYGSNKLRAEEILPGVEYWSSDIRSYVYSHYYKAHSVSGNEYYDITIDGNKYVIPKIKTEQIEKLLQQQDLQQYLFNGLVYEPNAYVLKNFSENNEAYVYPFYDIEYIAQWEDDDVPL